MTQPSSPQSQQRFKPQADESEPMTDPNMEKLKNLDTQYRAKQAEMEQAKRQLWMFVKYMKDEGYSYSQLVAGCSLAHGTIQNIALDYPYR